MYASRTTYVRKPKNSPAQIRRELKSIEEKYGVSWERFYYLAEVSNN